MKARKIPHWTKDYPIGGRFIMISRSSRTVDYWEIAGYTNGRLRLVGTMKDGSPAGEINRLPEEISHNKPESTWRFEYPKEDRFTKLYLILKNA